MSQIKLYADEHIRKQVISSLKSKGFDVLSTEEAGNKGRTDAEQLKFAISNGRAILTKDSDYFIIGSGIEHYGILFITKTEPDSEVVRKIVSILEMLEQEDLKGTIIYI